MKAVKTFKIEENDELNAYLEKNPFSSLNIFPETVFVISEDEKEKELGALRNQLNTAKNTRLQADFQARFARIRLSEPKVINPDEPVDPNETDWSAQIENNENIIRTMDTHIAITEDMIKEIEAK